MLLSMLLCARGFVGRPIGRKGRLGTPLGMDHLCETGHHDIVFQAHA